MTEIDGNLLLNEGIQLLLDLLIGAGGTAYNNANSYIGAGDTNTAESAAQTGLQAPTNKLYKAMEATYPSRCQPDRNLACRLRFQRSKLRLERVHRRQRIVG